LSAPRSEQFERQLFAQDIERKFAGAESYQQIRVAGGHQQTRTRAQHIEGLGILRAPQIVEYEQARFAFE
jgi:hypothetical protein